MSNDYNYTGDNYYYPAQPAHQKPRKKRWPWLVGIPAAGFLMLISCGTGGALMAGETEEVEVPGPTETVTPEPEVVTETEEVEVEVETEVTPQSCLDALDYADESMDLLMLALEYSGDALEAAAVMDVAGIEEATANIEELQPEMEDAGFNYGFYSEGCRVE